MALITRVARLFRADLHAVLDRLEEPDVLLRQAVREMEDEMGRDEQRLKLWKHEHKQLGAREAEIVHSLEQLDGELDICFESAKEDLARTLIRRRLETQALEKVLSTKYRSLDVAIAELATRIDENRTRLESMRQKVELLSEENRVPGTDDNWSGYGPEGQMPVREEDVEVAFLREKQTRSLA